MTGGEREQREVHIRLNYVTRYQYLKLHSSASVPDCNKSQQKRVILKMYFLGNISLEGVFDL